MTVFYSANQSATYQRRRKKHSASMRRTERKPEFRPMEVRTGLVVRDGADHKSIPSRGVQNVSSNSGARKESPQYTGTLVKGISTLHKSNAVPVISKEEAIEHSQMRRN